MEFETKLNRLQEIVQSMESGELALEESLKLFEEGIRLSRECNLKLNEAEQKVKVLMGLDEKGQAVSEDFVSTEN